MVYSTNSMRITCGPFGFFVGCILLVVGTTTYAQSSPQLFIISPAPGEVIQGTRVKVVSELPANLTLRNPEIYTTHTEGEGHLHVWLDALPAHDDTISVVLHNSTEYTFENVISGLHTLHVEYFRNDHRPYEPSLYASVEFETVAEELKSVPRQEGSVEAPPETEGGLFLPRGQGNTTLTLLIVVLIVAILWHAFGRKRS